ncbi:hypothetical protein [Mycolicibacterium sp. HK-90]|uniref:hypothetical protein n=1 Tax=Mycolicibacterium sp. HK-90 TaxID=3056937 RepID=UPI00265A3B00|nr:hypothetical protein [Mycolicibacterium sp. HK-90]WKG03526.1 hypothetical protein QU592_30915 [Mycolicibacterium sp. HK-90]
MAPTRSFAVLSALVLGTTIAAGAGPSTIPARADPVDTTTAPIADGFAYQPLWPFATQDEADRWLGGRTDAAGAPWHADPKATALQFTRNYLGFTEIDRTTTITEDADEAWVGVGYASPSGQSATAATIHLARFGTDPNAPWEVVGSRDDVLTLSTPPYASTAGPVIEAGGTITGVDESLHLQARQSTQANPLGDSCCISAGGESEPWSATLHISSPPQPGALTLVVWTGGHVAEVEKFAVTGLRVE